MSIRKGTFGSAATVWAGAGMAALAATLCPCIAQPLSLSIGPAAELTPRFPGARDSRTFLLPNVEAEYGDWYISGTDLLGVRALNRPALKAGAAVEYDFTERRRRDLSDLRRDLAGLPADVHTTPRFKLFAEGDAGWFAGGANVATDIGGHGEGTIAVAHLELQFPLTERGYFTIGPGATWSDERYMKSFFGVSAALSARSGLAPFDARAGISDVHAEAVAGYQFNPRWSGGVDVTAARLRDGAARSPFTESRSQTTLLLTVGYKIR